MEEKSFSYRTVRRARKLVPDNRFITKMPNQANVHVRYTLWHHKLENNANLNSWLKHSGLAFQVPQAERKPEELRCCTEINLLYDSSTYVECET